MTVGATIHHTPHAWPLLNVPKIDGEPAPSMLAASTAIAVMDDRGVATVAIVMRPIHGSLGLYQPLDRATAEIWIAQLRAALDRADQQNGAAR